MIEPEKLSAPIAAVITVVNVKSNGSAAPLASREMLHQFAHRHERCRAAAAAVEDRDHLRHRGHLHGASEVDADDRADREAREDDVPLDRCLARTSRSSAMTMPAIERRLPKRAVFGELMYLSPRMNKIPVIKYATLYHVAYAVTVAFMLVVRLLRDDRRAA